MTGDFEFILYEVENGRARITLNRPEKRNALSIELVEELRTALWEADDNKSVHCIIIKGNGKSFCAGYDLTPTRLPPTDEVERRRGRGFDDDAWNIERFQRCLKTLTEIHKPSIAQIPATVTGGTDLALYCDMLICSDDARFATAPCGTWAGAQSDVALSHRPSVGKRLLLTGDTINGQEAAHLGLVLKSVPVEHLESEVEGLADRLSSIDSDMLSVNKRSINIGLELMGAQTLQRLAAENDARAHTSQAARSVFKQIGSEGLAAALEQRDAPFGDSKAKVLGPEIRDQEGRLIDD